jgi:xanthine dehydrogenase YagR molybdenum-binding subunit
MAGDARGLRASVAFPMLHRAARSGRLRILSGLPGTTVTVASGASLGENLRFDGDDMTHPVQAAAAVTGQPVARVDGRQKVTGAARYAADNPVADVLYAALVCSTVARGTVELVDGSAAVKDQDVLRVIDSFGGVTLPFDPGEVAFFGQPVAVVVAKTLEAATHGASQVTVRYNVAAQVSDIDSPQAKPQPGQRQTDYTRGDPDAALHKADVVSDIQYSIVRYNHNSMELPSTIARWEGDRLTVWDKAQGINAAQAVYGKAFGISADNVRVICPFIGGAFGSAGGTWPHQIMTAFAAKQVRRPVKLVLTRKQMYNSIGYRPASRQRLAIGADRAGAITVIVHEGRTESAHYQSFEDSITGPAKVLYNSPNMRSTYRVVPLDVNVGCPMRGPGGDAGGLRARIRNRRPRPPPRARPHRAENSQPTGSGPDEQSAVLDASAPRLPHTGRRRIWVVAAEPSPALDA